MSTKSKLPIIEIGSQKPNLFSRVRSTIETAFYMNNVIEVKTIAQAYEIAKNARGTIVLDQPVYNAPLLGLPNDAKVLLFNDGNITGRQARLRQIINKYNTDQFSSITREVTFQARKKKLYHASVYVGLDKEFMIKAHLLIPEGYENTMYSWLLNFQICNEEYDKMYQQSKDYDEGDIYIFSDPEYYPTDYPEGLALFDPENNCACLLGLRYFGEHKKGTLTLAWTIAERNGYTACHGGQKRFILGENKDKVISVFGLSGSGKSTITLSNHCGRFKTTVLHDDAFIISNKDASSISLEQAYFDKTQDFPITDEQAKYFVSVQNCGATIDDEGKVAIVTEDIYSGNGRCIKSKFATPNREYQFSSPTNAIFWIMKDPTLPPVLKVECPKLASAFGATLATKRTTAEYIVGEDINALVIIPYANPFRLYPLANDYEKFKHLFAKRNVDCYIINTGFFLNKKVTKATTLGLIEDIVNENAQFVPFGPFTKLHYLPIEGFIPDFEDLDYLKFLKARMMDRLNYVIKLNEIDKLPEEAINAITKLTEEI